MRFVPAVKSCLSKYVTWQRRAPASEYWWFNLFYIIVAAATIFIDFSLGTTFTTVETDGSTETYGYVFALAMYLLFLPFISVTVRRLHDRNKSGWWYWIALIPAVGPIILLVWFISKGTTGTNDYGPDPLAGA